MILEGEKRKHPTVPLEKQQMQIRTKRINTNNFSQIPWLADDRLLHYQRIFDPHLLMTSPQKNLTSSDLSLPNHLAEKHIGRL